MTPVELKSGELVALRYRVLREIDSSGSYAEYLALEERGNRIWVMKTLREEHGPNSDEQRKRLAREAELLGELRHPCIPRLRETIEQDGALLLVMDYVEGVSFARELEQHGPLSWRETLRLALELCGVLDYLHRQDKPLIYADLNPDKLRRKPDGSLMLLEYGSVRTCGSETTGEDVDTEGCAAPERYSPGAAVDTRTDALIRAQMNRMPKKPTRILISHRVTTLMDADRIVVLDKGRVVEQGTHAELLRKGGMYARICALQSPEGMGGEEK